MKNIVAFLFFFTQLCFSSNTPEISILTCSPGDEVYSVFGHSAVRFVDKENSIDLVYNFGMFDFDSPNFTFKFVRGKLTYFLGIQKTEDFIQQYTKENRQVLEQSLNLSEKEKNKLIAKLNFLYRPENRQYLYSFLEKNCSTEIRDLLTGLGVNFSNKKLAESNRDLINFHLTENLWLRFGTNLMLGKALDRKSDKFRSMFLPVHLKEEIGNSYLNGKRLVKSEQVLNRIENKNKIVLSNWFSPIVIFILLSFLLLFRFPKPIGIIICILVGSIGFILSLMWIFSEHPEVKYNLNIIWCNPLYLIYLPLMIKNKSSILLALILFLTILSTILIWIFGLQSFDLAILPILLILGILNFKQITITDYKFK